jgi:hypothetical protein
VTVLSVSAFGYLPSNLDYVNGISKGFPAFYFLAEVFRYLNTYLTVALCVDRYLSVCHARKAQDMCTKKRALIAISAIICSNVVFNVPKVRARGVQRSPEGLVRYPLGLPYPTTLRLGGSQPLAGLTVAQRIAAHRVNILFYFKDPLDPR